MKQNRKRLVSLGMACLLAATTITGCMPTQSDETKATLAETTAAAVDGSTAAAETVAELEVNTTDPITLRFNWWGGDSRHEKTLAAIRAFEEKYPNIKVEGEYEAFSGHEEKVALSIKAGSAADLIQLNMDWVFAYSPKGETFCDLNQLSNIIDLSYYDDTDKAFYTINGSLQALPIANTGRGFIWNKTTYDKVGVAIPTTLEELMAAGEAFAAYEDGSYYPFAVADYAKIHLMIYYLQCKYGREWIKDNQLQYSEAELAEGLSFIKELEDKHVIPNSEKLTGEGTSELLETSESWINGKYAGAMCWDTNIAKYEEAVVDGEIVVGDMVSMGEFHGGPIKASQVIAIAGNTKYPAETAALLQFLFGEEEGAEILGDSRGIPCNKNAVKYVETEGSKVAEMNEKLMAWSSFKLDTITERAALKAPDGIYTLTIQTLSYGEDGAEGCAKMLIDGINKEIASAISQ